MEETGKASGYFFAVLAALLWALIGPISRLCYAEGLQPMELAFWRTVFGGACFITHAALKKELIIPKRPAMIFCGFGFWAIAMLFTIYQTSIQLNGISVALVLLYTAPAWVALFARALFKEVISGRKLAAIAVAMAGAAMVSLSGTGAGGALTLTGILCGLLSGLMYATHYPFYLWWKNSYSSVTIYAYMLLGGTLLLLPVVTHTPHKSLTAWAALFSLGAITNYAAYYFYAEGMKRISPVRVAVLSNFEPLAGIFMAWLFWNEMFSTGGWIGSAMIMTAVFILSTDKS